jgi:hypothetical protein
VLAEVAKIWEATGLGPVVGITPSQSARNTLAAGVTASYNSARFLGHLPGKRGARGPVRTGPGTLMVIDEGSMMTGPDLADLITLAEAQGGKVILAGDTEQLQAVQNGGGMSLLADRLGYVRLAQPVRFRAAWEKAATLRLRDGDTTVLADYDQHGRIAGGDPEQMIDAAAAAYTALAAAGTDALLMAADHALRRELSRRIRDDLLRLGLVRPGKGVTIADGTTASVGDLIVCTRNNNKTEAGEPGRTLANGDLLRVDAVTDKGLLVRRALDADPRTGQRRWTDRQFLYADYKEAELGYAVTDHAAQGRTVHTGLAVFSGAEDRQHAYVALTRGVHENTAYVFTKSPKRADPAPGPRPAPELARYDRLADQAPAQSPEASADEHEDALCVLAEILGKDGQLSSASQTWQEALSDADHLAILHAIWAAETAPAREQRYRDLFTAALPPDYQAQDSHREKWLWRTLHAAELAGLDAGQVLTAAVAERSLAGADDIAAVIDSRIRHRTGTLVPLPAPAWSAQVPDMSDPERHAYLVQVAELMDARKERIGEHAAASSLPWAAGALGPVLDDPVARLDWQRRASSIGAYRELSGYGDPADPVGPEPGTSSPYLRAAWHEAFAALGPADGPDARAMSDGLLLRLRDTYPVETAWAPRWAGDELRRTRTAARDARLSALRATAEAGAARRRGDHDDAGRHQSLAASYHAMHQTYRTRETALAQAMEDRTTWEHATRQQRQLALAADAELRRRHPTQPWPALRSAEPEPEPLRDTSTPGQALEKTSRLIEDLAARHQEFAGKLAERQSAARPADSPGFEGPGPAFPARAASARDAILQPPKPQTEPSERVLERLTARTPDREAAD